MRLINNKHLSKDENSIASQEGENYMKIAILGYSGSGKSTTAQKLSIHYNIEVLHLDTVQFLPNWVERDDEEKRLIVKNFMDTHDQWIIEGNYSKLFQERRLSEADIIIILLFNRWQALVRVIKRYFKYRGRSREDMADGCNEKLDKEFIRWVLFDGRSSTKREHYKRIFDLNKSKTIIINNQTQLDEFMIKIYNS